MFVPAALLASVRFEATCSMMCRRARAEGFSDSWRKKAPSHRDAYNSSRGSQYCGNATGHTARVNAPVAANPLLRQMTGGEAARACISCLPPGRSTTNKGHSLGKEKDELSTNGSESTKHPIRNIWRGKKGTVAWNNNALYPRRIEDHLRP